MQINTHVSYRSFSTVSLLTISLFMSSPKGYAETWLLIDFGASSTQNRFGLPGWNTVIKSDNTVYSDVGPAGTILETVAGEDWTQNYQGIQGIPRDFVRGEQIIVTWYNNSDYDLWFTPRISFDDADGFNIGTQTGHWYGMSDATGHRDNTETITILAQSTTITTYVINNEPAEGVPSSIGSKALVNVSVGTSDFYPYLICDKIEINNEVDSIPPSTPTQLQSTSISHYRIGLFWNASTDNIDVDEYRIYINESLYRVTDGTQIDLVGLEGSTEYSISVSAVDLIGNESERSESIRITTPPFQGKDTLINPQTDFKYLGAFRLPDGEYGVNNFYYSGDAATYYPSGDPDGPNDGFPGSIFLTSFFAVAAEISIPPPILSPEKNFDSLNAAGVLQPFNDISGGYPMTDMHWWQGLAYLPAQGNQTTDKLYYTFAEHLYFEEQNAPSHSWFELNLAHPNVQGFWRMANNLHNYLSSRYLFEIPEAWAAMHTPNYRLITGRCRRGGQLGAGPAMYAFGPWNDGNPPQNNAELSYTTLLQYGDYSTDQKVDNWAEGDFWTGAWLTLGNKSAVMFVGTKFTGFSYYGYYDGTVFTDIEFDSDFGGEDRGFMATTTKGQMMFYDPDDFVNVIAGRMAPYEPQPYAVMDIDDVLFGRTQSRVNEMERVNAPTYDRERDLLYLFENRGDELPVVHIWKLESDVPAVSNWRLQDN